MGDHGKVRNDLHLLSCRHAAEHKEIFFRINLRWHVDGREVCKFLVRKHWKECKLGTFVDDPEDLGSQRVELYHFGILRNQKIAPAN